MFDARVLAFLVAGVMAAASAVAALQTTTTTPRVLQAVITSLTAVKRSKSSYFQAQVRISHCFAHCMASFQTLKTASMLISEPMFSLKSCSLQVIQPHGWVLCIYTGAALNLHGRHGVLLQGMTRA